MKIDRLVLAFALVLSLVAGVFADTIRLKNGSIIKGRITGFAGGTFTVTIGEGPRERTLSFSADEIESIEFDSRPAVARRSDPVEDPVRVVPAASPQRSSSNPRVVTSDSTASTQPRSAQPAPRPTPAPAVQASANRTSSTQRVTKPIELTVNVLADNTANGWTNSGWVVRQGQRIRITGDGQVSLGGGRMTSPGGLYEIEDRTKLMQAVPTGALIAVIGDDNNDFIYVGMEREFVAKRDGLLFLGVNEGNLDDNSGSFTVKVEILPDGE